MAFSISGNEITSLADGKILVICPKDKASLVPLFCPVCAFTMKTLDDSVSYRAHGCCAKCEMYWSGSKLGSWKDGWRPNPTVSGWDEYIQERKLLSRGLINLK